MNPPPDAPPDESILAKGAGIGRYVVLGLVGRGGMGDVYAAYDPELDRKIAIKLLRMRGTAAADGDEGRLLREAQAIARLSHPNVVVVYDVGTFKGSVFIAMEFIEGVTLRQWLPALKREWPEVLGVFVAAGRGLGAAHAAGLVHRDFKPDNVMLTKTGQVRVMDFGLARTETEATTTEPTEDNVIKAARRSASLAAVLRAPEAIDATVKVGTNVARASSGSGDYLGQKLTQTGMILGTPAYMAPEQFAGTGADGRSDQFAFCVALFEGLYGQRPFAGTNFMMLRANIMAGALVLPPSDARVPGWVRRVLFRGLSVRPEDRFSSMTELLAALGQDPAAQRRRWLAASGGALALLAIAGGVHQFSSRQRILCDGAPSRAETAWGPAQRGAIERAFNASGNKTAGTVLASTVGLLDQYVARWEGMYKETCQATHVRGEQSAEVLDLRMTCLNERLGDVRALGEVLATADKSVVDNAVSAASALPPLDRCADVAMLRSVIKPPDDPGKRAQVAKLKQDAAKVNALALAGRCNAAKVMGMPLLDGAKHLGYRPLEAEAALALGLLGDSCLDPASAADYLEEAALSAEASNNDEVAVRASCFLAVLYAERLTNRIFSRYWVRHAEALLARFPSHPLLDAEVATARSVWLGSEGRDEEALADLKRALTLRESVRGLDSLETVDTILDIMVRLHALGRDPEALSFGDRARQVAARVSGADSGQMALVLLDQSEVLTALGRFEDARVAVARAIEIWKNNDAAPFYLGYGLLYRGRLELAEGRPTSARPDIQQALTMLHDEDGIAQAKFALARALWFEPSERPRALTLAGESQTVFAKLPSRADYSRQVNGWLEGRHQP